MANKNEDLSGMDEQVIKKKKLYDKQDIDNVRANMGVKKSPYAIPNNLDVSEKVWNKIQKTLEEYFEEIDRSKDDMRDKIDLWESAYLQEPIDIDPDEEPFENSCKLRSSFTATACTVVTNKIYKRTTVSPYFLASVRGDDEKEKKLQDYINTKCELDFDYKKFMRKLSEMAPKYPFVIAVPERVREVQSCHDFDVFENIYGVAEGDESGEEVLLTKGIDTFKAKYPDAESVKLTPEQYQEKIRELQEEIDDHDYAEFHYDYERVYEYSDVSLVHPLNYAQFPWDSDESLAKLAAIKIEKTFDQLLRLERDGIIKDKTARVIPQAYVPTDTEIEVDVVKEAKDVSSGINDQNALETYKSKIFKPYKGYIRLSEVDLGIGDSYLEQDYEFWYLVDERVLLRLAPPMYNYKKRNLIKLSVGDMCLSEMAENPQKVIDTLLRQYIDSNSMTNVPEFTMNDQSYRALKQQRDGLKHRIGKIWRLKSGSMEPLSKPITYGPAYMSLLQYIAQENEARMGSTKPGQPPSGDPGASGVKTMALLQQSDFMVSRYIDNLSLGLSEVVIHLLKQDRQFEKFNKVPVKRNSLGSGRTDFFGRNDIEFDESVTTFTVKTQSADDNAESRLTNAIKKFEFYTAVPMIANRPQSVNAILRKTLSKDEDFTLDDVREIVPSLEEIKAEQVQIQEDATISLQEKKKTEDINANVNQVAEEATADFDKTLEEPEVQ